MGRLILIALLAVSACDQPVTEQRAHDIAAQEVGTQNALIEARVSKLEDQVQQLEGEMKVQSKVADIIAKNVDDNANTANKNELDEMTRRGACGYELTIGPAGGHLWTPRACKLADMRQTN